MNQHPDQSSRHVAVIGAGMAGAAAVRKMRLKGLACTVFDKSRGVGGRMATRRTDDLRFDHGAQYFTARGVSFSRAVEDWQAAGQVGAWFDGGFVGTPAMNAPVKALLDNTPVRTSCQVTGLQRGADGWTVIDESGPVDAIGNGRFSSVVIAVPAPQAVPLVQSAGLEFPELSDVRYAPCWAVMLSFVARGALAEDRLRFEEGPIAWMARNASKPGRDDAVETVVAHASPAWSREHLEDSPEQVIAALTPALRAALVRDIKPVAIAAHRWRFALVEEPAAKSCLWNRDVNIGACGDWALGPRIEAAFDSGEAAAQAVLSSWR